MDHTDPTTALTGIGMINSAASHFGFNLGRLEMCQMSEMVLTTLTIEKVKERHTYVYAKPRKDTIINDS